MNTSVLTLSFILAIFNGGDAYAERAKVKNLRITSPNSFCAVRFGQLMRAELEVLPTDAQAEIWKLKDLKRLDEAQALRKRTEHAMKQMAIVSSKTSERNRSLVFIEFANGMKGIWRSTDKIGARFANPPFEKDLTTAMLDDVLDARLVPLTVQRELKGRQGFMQLISHEFDDDALISNPRALMMFDFLSAHPDRNANQYLTQQGRIVALRNRSTFSPSSNQLGSPKFDRFIVEQLRAIEASTNPRAARLKAINEIAPTLISKNAVDNLKTTSDAEWGRRLEGLSGLEFEAFIDRKNRAVRAIETAEKVLGHALYPAEAFSGLNRNRWLNEAERLEQILGSSLAEKIPAATKTRAQKAQRLITNETKGQQPLTAEDLRFIDQTMKEIDALLLTSSATQE